MERWGQRETEMEVQRVRDLAGERRETDVRQTEVGPRRERAQEKRGGEPPRAGRPAETETRRQRDLGRDGARRDQRPRPEWAGEAGDGQTRRTHRRNWRQRETKSATAVSPGALLWEGPRPALGAGGEGASVPRRRKWGVGAQVLGWERREAVPGLRFVGLLLQGVGGLDSRGCERRGLGTGPRAPGDGWGAASGPPPGAGTGSRVPVAGRGGGGGRAPRTRERRGLGAQLPKFSEEEKPESQVPAPLKKAAGGP